MLLSDANFQVPVECPVVKSSEGRVFSSKKIKNHSKTPLDVRPVLKSSVLRVFNSKTLKTSAQHGNLESVQRVSVFDTTRTLLLSVPAS